MRTPCSPAVATAVAPSPGARRSRLRWAAGVAALATATALAPLPAAAAPSTGLVISEVYGGGGNSGATYRSDFVELQNRSGAAIDLAGSSVQYRSAAGTTWQVTALTGTVAAGGYFVLAEATGAGGTADVPAQQTGTIALSATSGVVALVASTTPCAGNTCAAVDLVGYGAATLFEEAAAPAGSNTTSVGRVTTPDTDDNATDFVAGDPTPGAGPSGPITPPAPPEPGPLRIHDIQGAAFLSPDAGQSVSNVPGVVTAVRTTGSSRGFFLQDPTPDADPATSEGIFVFTSTPTVAVGDSVLVSGRVQEYYSDAAPATARTLSTTEITGSTAVVLSHGNALPAAEILTPTTVPELYAPDLGGGNIESTPLTPARSALDFWESREGMLVEVDDARVVGPTDSYGEQYVTTKPEQKPTFRGGTLLTAENATPSGRIEVVPVTPGSAVNVGDTYAGATSGPVDYSRYGGFLIAATRLGTVRSGGLTRTVLAPADPSRLTIATYNVENLAPTNPQTKFDALAAGITGNLASPDIVALEEIQDDDGATDDGVVAADATITRLIAAVTAAGGPAYRWREIDPANDSDGGQPGGNIRNVFLYNASRVTFVDRGAAGVDRTTTGTAVTGTALHPDLTLSPGRIAPTDAAWTSSRKPLVGEFSFRGRPVFVVANHFDSKLGDQNADGRFQYPTRSSEVQRQQQATLVHGFVLSLLRRSPLAAAVVLGDLNDYQFSPALQRLTTGQADGRGLPILLDLVRTLPADQQYTYVFDGISQVLDHILLTPGVFLADAVSYRIAHINSEFTDQTSDHDPQVVSLRPRG